MKVLVTGGCGFIGSHTVEELIKKNYEVIVIDNLSTGNKTWLPKNIKLYETDILSTKIIDIFQLEQPDFVIHLAANVDVATSMENPLMDATNNILSTVKLLQCCKLFGVEKFIYASSCAVYGETGDCSIHEDFPIKPLSYYGISKYTPELYIKQFSEHYDLSYTILRYANVYGPRQTPKGEGGVISIFYSKLFQHQRPTIYGDGKQTRDFIFVKDVAKANVLALTRANKEVINISCNSKTSINTLYNYIREGIPVDIEPFYSPTRSGDILYSQLNNQKAITLLSWSPLSNLKEGLEITSSYYKNLFKD